MIQTHPSLPQFGLMPITDLERRFAEFDAIVLTYRVLDGIERDFEHCHTSRQGLPDEFRPDRLYGVPFYVYPLADQLEPKARELRATGKRVLVLDGK